MPNPTVLTPKSERSCLLLIEGQAGTGRLVLGTRAPSPAMSAKRETAIATRRLRLRLLRTLRRARAPALPVRDCLFLPPTFVGKALSSRWLRCAGDCYDVGLEEQRGKSYVGRKSLHNNLPLLRKHFENRRPDRRDPVARRKAKAAGFFRGYGQEPGQGEADARANLCAGNEFDEGPRAFAGREV